MLDPKMIGKKKKAAEAAGKGARRTAGGGKRKPDSKLDEMGKMDFENMTEE